MSGTRVWLDDVRRPPSDDWHWARTVDEAIEALCTGRVVELSLDNDLHPFVRDGSEVCDWMVENDVWPDLIHVHTANARASLYMCGLIEKSGFESLPRKIRSFRRRGDRKKPEDL